MSLGRVVIIHGYAASPHSYWFGALRDELEGKGVDADIPRLPSPDSPDPESWIATALAAIGTPSESTAVVTHSLGTVTALHALARTPGPWRLGKFVAVAGFLHPLPALPQLDHFTASPVDLTGMSARIDSRTVLLSDNDVYVPAAHTLALAATLDARIITVARAGHFLSEDGVTSLPVVASTLLDPTL